MVSVANVAFVEFHSLNAIMLSVIVLNVMVPINGALVELHSKYRLIALPTNIRLGWTWLTVTNTLADYAIEFIAAVIFWCILNGGFINNFQFGPIGWSVCTWKAFQPWLKFVNNAKPTWV